MISLSPAARLTAPFLCTASTPPRRPTPTSSNTRTRHVTGAGVILLFSFPLPLLLFSPLRRSRGRERRRKDERSGEHMRCAEKRREMTEYAARQKRGERRKSEGEKRQKGHKQEQKRSSSFLSFFVSRLPLLLLLLFLPLLSFPLVHALHF